MTFESVVKIKGSTTLYRVDRDLVCILDGSLDEGDFDVQCSKCDLKNRCKVIRTTYKNIAGDWHGLNRDAFYASIKEWTPELKKSLRKVAKACGLALTYGGTSYTLKSKMGCTGDEAQDKIDDFFSKLPVLNGYMVSCQQKVMSNHYVANLFGRFQDMSFWTKSREPTQKLRNSANSYARRTSLNQPIQGTASDILKIETLRLDAYVLENKTNPLAGLSIPQKLDFTKTSHRSLNYAPAMSVHDELVNVMRTALMPKYIADVYEIMQLKDILGKFGCKFELTCDVEYDSHRSYTAKNAYPPALVRVLLDKKDKSRSGDLEPNCLIIPFKEVTHLLIGALDSFKASSESTFFFLGVESDSTIQFYRRKIPISLLERLGLKFQLKWVDPVSASMCLET
jgi:hypothetical protein